MIDRDRDTAWQNNGVVSKTVDEAVEDIGYGSYQRRLICIVGVIAATDSMQSLLLVIIQTCIKDHWDLSDAAESALTAVVFAGAFIGYASGGPFADKYGRRSGLIWGMFLVVFFSLVSVFSPTYWTLLAARMLVGIGIGMSQTVAYDLVAEMLPLKYRSYLVFLNLISAIFMLYVIFVAWIFLEDFGWRYVTFGVALPSLLTLLCSYYMVYESPRWLVCNENSEDAAKVLRRVAEINHGKVNIRIYICMYMSTYVCM
jgi:putative MFS transporter